MRGEEPQYVSLKDGQKSSTNKSRLQSRSTILLLRKYSNGPREVNHGVKCAVPRCGSIPKESQFIIPVLGESSHRWGARFLRNPGSQFLFWGNRATSSHPSLPTASEFMHRCSVFICLSRLRIYSGRRG